METQDTAENPRGKLLAAEQRLLAERIPAYLDAMMAIQELRQAIQKRCRGVLCKRLEEFSRAIRIALDATQIKDCAEPYRVNNLATIDSAFLGVVIPLQGAGTVYVGLIWAQEDGQNDQSPAIWAYVAITYNDRNRVDRMLDMVKRVTRDVERDDAWTIGLYKPVPADRISNFEAILSDLMGEWSSLWQRVGGLP